MAAPGTPRPEVKDVESDGVYRSLFQQPMIEIPPTAPSYAWFEFLLHPEALQKHLETLRHQNAKGAHTATSAIELVREFLDQAQLVADEGNIRNNRYKALLLVAAQVALQMDMTLNDIEAALPLHFQRLLVDGIVDFAEAKEPRNALPKPVTIAPHQAHVLHNRWTLRAIVKQSQSGYLTCSSKNEAEELMSSFQIALGDLSTTHLQVANNVQAILLNEDTQALPKRTQLGAMYDLGVYFFSFNTYDKAYEFFSRASEMIEDECDLANALSEDERVSLEGYLTACQAVLEACAVPTAGNEHSIPTPSKTEAEQAWEGRDWDRAERLLQDDILADETTRLPVRVRTTIKNQALNMLRAKPVHDSSHDALRLLYKRISVNNAVATLVHADEQGAAMELEMCLCTWFRLLQEEIFIASASSLRHQQESRTEPVRQPSSQTKELVHFLFNLSSRLYRAAPESHRHRLANLVRRTIQNFPFVLEFPGVAEAAKVCDAASVLSHQRTLTQDTELEVCMREAISYQRNHFRAASDLANMFEFTSNNQRDKCITNLHQQWQSPGVADALTQLPGAHTLTGKNVALFCVLNNCWDLLAQWKDSLPPNTSIGRHLEFLLAARALMDFLSSSVSLNTEGFDGGAAKRDFAILESNRLVLDLLLKRRDAINTSAVDSKDATSNVTPDENDNAEESAKLLLDLPLWALETLVCISAGLLHRAFMRNISDYRISFDLTPYGDLALVQAFAPEVYKKPAAGQDGKDDANAVVSTAILMKGFQADIVALHTHGLACLLKRCPREPRWHCAMADLSLNPLVKQKFSSTSDPAVAVRGYLVAASLATNFFSDMTSVVDIIDQSSLVRLSQCLVKLGSHVAAAVLYQCFAPEDFKYGLRILQLAPETHDDAFFQYFWELPFLELLVHLHSNAKHYNTSHVTLLSHLIQSPELNSSNPAHVIKDVEQRILRCYFRDLCRMFLV